MAKVQTIGFKDFMNKSYKTAKKKSASKLMKRVGTAIAIPLVAPKPAFAATTDAVPAGAVEWMGEKTLSALAHVLDPVVDVMVALSFPVASVIIVGSLFFFMFGNAEKAWSTIQNAGLGYVLIQVSPLILNVLKQIGEAV